MGVIRLTKDQQQVVDYRGGHIQVIACAGSGKTESISRRVAALISEGEKPESIVAFTFTERAAGELKERIYERVGEAKGPEFLGRLAPMFVGTIHSYCFRLLQTYIPKYGDYDVLDEHRHIGLLSREYKELSLQELGRRHWKPIRDFAWSVDVIGNELIDPAQLAGTPLGICYDAYVPMLTRFKFLTYNQIIAQAVEALADPVAYARIHDPLRHLVVDEYQDINPAQERLIELLSARPVHLCVVGDDDQSIYQWRGSDVANILTFAQRKREAECVRLETNRRSRPDIVKAANTFAKSIPGRLEKAMKPTRPAGTCHVVPWMAETPEEEAGQLAKTICELHRLGYRYQDMAILFRSVRTSAPVLIQAFEAHGVPYVCSGRTGLFLQPEINLFGEIFAWFVDGDWKDERFGPSRDASLDRIVNELSKHFDKQGPAVDELRTYLADWRKIRLAGNRPVSLVGDFYRLLSFLGAERIDIDSPEGSARFGAFARFSELLADFEHVTRRGRYVEDEGGRIFRGGQDRGKSYYRQLYNYIRHYARDAYEDFEAKQRKEMDAVDILTVHQAKGLEWPIVFLPALSSQRFPSKYAGQAHRWLIPENALPQETRRRYEGGDADERRLFYVAMTRARETLYLSTFARITHRAKPSLYLDEVAANYGGLLSNKKLPLPPAPDKLLEPEPPPLALSFSEIANFDECGFRYRLSQQFGFQQELATELGYGKAIHHILRNVAEVTRRSGSIPTPGQVDDILKDEFYLPFARQPEFTRMYQSACGLVRRYLSDYAEDLRRVWETERPFQLHLPEGTIAGRADVILDEEGGHPGKLAIVDYKTATDPRRDEYYQLQMAVYAEAARGEGLDVVAGYVHELEHGTRREVDVSENKNAEAIERVKACVGAICRGEFEPCPSQTHCAACDFRLVCRHNAATET